MKPAALVGGALLLVAAAAVVYSIKVAEKMPDFEVYWRAGYRVAHAQPLYTPDDGHYQFKYLPAFAMLAVPFAWVPLPVAKAAWFALSTALLAAFVATSIALLPDRRKRVWVLALGVVLAMAKFYGHELVLGQVNIVLGVLVTAAVHLLRARKEIPAGLAIVAAMIVKPYAVVFLPWLAGIRRGRALATSILGLVVALVMPSAVYGLSTTWQLHIEWWRTVTMSTAPNLLNTDNVSLAAMFAKWLGIGSTASSLAMLASLGLLVMFADVVRRRKATPDPLGLESALLLTSIPLISPQGWDYVFLLATPAVAFLANYEDRLPRLIRFASIAAVGIAAFSLFDLMGRRLYSAFMALSITTICFLVVFGALHALRARRTA